jgi:hypothetical protein
MAADRFRAPASPVSGLFRTWPGAAFPPTLRAGITALGRTRSHGLLFSTVSIAPGAAEGRGPG